MNQDRLVSIVIPCFNHHDHVWNAVRSCLSELDQVDLEVIVVDDGSEPPLEVPAGLRSDHLLLLRQNNKGLAAARNAGIARARGQFLKFLDADDVLLPGGLAIQLQSLRPDSLMMSIGGYRLVDTVRGGGRPIIPKFGRLDAALCKIHVGPPPIYLFPAFLFDRFGGFDTSERTRGGHEDYELVCRFARHGVGAVVVHDYVACYFKRPGSMSTKVHDMERTRLGVWHEHLRGMSARADQEVFEYALAGLIGQLVDVRSPGAAVPVLREAWGVVRSMHEHLGACGNAWVAAPGMAIQLRAWLNGTGLQSDGAPAVDSQVLDLASEILEWLGNRIGFHPATFYLGQELVDPRALFPAMSSQGVWMDDVLAWVVEHAPARLALYGESSVAEQLVRWLVRLGNPPLCIFDRDPAKHGRSYGGVPVVGFERLESYAVEHVIICNNSRYSEIKDAIEAYNAGRPGKELNVVG